MSTTSRRTALRGSMVALIAGIAAPGLADAMNPDAELIAACNEAIRCEARLRHIDKHGTSEEDCEDALNAWDATYTQVTDLSATTTAGVHAKAYVLKLAIVRENATGAISDQPIDDIPIYDNGRLDAALAMSLSRDILALGGVA